MALGGVNARLLRAMHHPGRCFGAAWPSGAAGCAVGVHHSCLCMCFIGASGGRGKRWAVRGAVQAPVASHVETQGFMSHEEPLAAPRRVIPAQAGIQACPQRTAV